MSFRYVFVSLLLGLFVWSAQGQLPTAPAPQTGSISGFAADTDDAAIPGAMVVAQGPDASDIHQHAADDSGYFKVTGLQPMVPYKVTITEKGFAAFVVQEVTLTPGQNYEIPSVRMTPEVVTSIDAMTSAELAVEEVHLEEQQRVLGIIPNFYVVYDTTNAVPLSTKLKFKLATKAGLDPVNFFAAIFLGTINQAADTPDYRQGWKGYGQRVGAVYADGLTDILFGGAVFPSLFHQDPRYFYQGTGTKKSRFWHAVSAPFICRGDNGKQEFNFASISGDLASGAMSNLYYPDSNRGVGLVFSNAGITTGGRILNALAQEFLLSKFTTRGKSK